MSQVTCPRCRWQVPFGPYCQHCGGQLPQVKPGGLNKKVLIAGGIVAFSIIALLIVGTIANKNKPRSSTIKSEPTAAVSQPPPTTVTDSQRLNEAKEIINSNRSKVELYNAKQLLEEINHASPEYKQVPALLKKVSAQIDEWLLEETPLVVVSSKWEKGGFDTIAIWHVTFHNRSKRTVGNIKFRTAYYAETGAQVDKGGVDGYGKDTVQKVIGPRQKRTLEINDGFVNQEAVRAKFELVSWEFID